MDRTEAIGRLRALEPDLRRMGIERLALFGSVARGSERPGSDLDVAIRLRENAGIGAFDFLRMEDRIAALLGSRVDLVVEPEAQQPRLQAEIDRDRVHVF